MAGERRVLVTGSSGLVGSAVVREFGRRGWNITGIDGGQRAEYFGEGGDTTAAGRALEAEMGGRLTWWRTDIAADNLWKAFRNTKGFDAVVHCAAQPSHDWAREHVWRDWQVNATATLRLLECTQQWCPEAPFVFLSTNKVYGDAVNDLAMVELETRYDWADGSRDGIDETMRMDRSLHSLFGVSKAAADLLVQEYGRTFGLRTTCLRCGCLTGEGHAGVALHGFLSYLTRCAVGGRRYTVIGHGGKQVRDQLHAEDVARACWASVERPGTGAVYNLGGGRANSVSVLEAIGRLGELGHRVEWTYEERPRLGDHAIWITDTGKFRREHEGWRAEVGLDEILERLVRGAVDGA